MDTNLDNIFDMEKEQMKAVIKTIARNKGISPSELAQEAGIAPSTITGFLNNREGRAKHGLSAQTQNKLVNTFPEFNDAFDIPQPKESVKSIPVIGAWSDHYLVRPIDVGMPSTVIFSDVKNVEECVAVISPHSHVARHVSNEEKINFISDTRYYVFKRKFETNLKICVGRLCYNKLSDGAFAMGFPKLVKGEFFVVKGDGNPIDKQEAIVGSSKVLFCYYTD